MATNLILASDRLPVDLERGASGGPRFKTLIQTQRSGREIRIPIWSRSRGEWDIAYGMRFIQDTNQLLSDVDKILAVFYAAQGRAAGFLFRDWADYKIGDPDTPANDKQQIGTGNGATTAFQIFKLYSTAGGATHQRDIKRIVNTTLSVFLDSVEQTETTDYTVDYATGIITFVSAPANLAVIEVACEFDVLVRFDDDHLAVTVETFEVGQVESVVVVEIKE